MRRWSFLLLAVLALGCAVRYGRALRWEPVQAAAEIPGPRYVALTFDDGPKRGTTDRLLDGLRERGVPATFFVIGGQAAEERDLIVRMRDEGHQVGSHTWSHACLEDLSREQILREVGDTEDLLRSITGDEGLWLRPPYGRIRSGTEELIPVPMVGWSVDPRDWESRDADAVVRAVMEAVGPGSVVLLHDLYPSSVDAALRLADLLSEEGYTLVTVEGLLRRSGIEPVPGQIYRSGDG